MKSICAVALMLAALISPALAQDESLDPTILGFAYMQWGWINCPPGTVTDEQYQSANAVIGGVPQDELQGYWQHIKDQSKKAGGLAASCPVLADAIASEVKP